MLWKSSLQVIRKCVSRLVQDDFSVFLFTMLRRIRRLMDYWSRNPFDSQYVPLSSIFILIFDVMTFFFSKFFIDINLAHRYSEDIYKLMLQLWVLYVSRHREYRLTWSCYRRTMSLTLNNTSVRSVSRHVIWWFTDIATTDFEILEDIMSHFVMKILKRITGVRWNIGSNDVVIDLTLWWSETTTWISLR